MNVLEPWVLLRLVAGLVAVLLFVRGAFTSYRVLRHFDVRHATEGQLALEKQVELGSTFVRVGTIVQVAALAMTVLAADRLSRSVRGAMCAYGVLSANEWGFRSLFATAGVALLAGVLAQLYALDARVRGMDLVRPVAIATLVVVPFAVADLALTTLFLTKLDLTAAASCCSVQLDASEAGQAGYANGPRVLTVTGASVAIALSVIVAWFASRRPTAPLVALAGSLALFTLPLAVAAAVLEVAPHAFEAPQHVCPFCLLKADVLGIGYPLFGAMFLAVVWGAGAALAGLLARGKAAREAFQPFARQRLRREIAAWVVVALLSAAPVVRYAVVSGGASLFP